MVSQVEYVADLLSLSVISTLVIDRNESNKEKPPGYGNVCAPSSSLVIVGCLRLQKPAQSPDYSKKAEMSPCLLLLRWGCRGTAVVCPTEETFSSKTPFQRWLTPRSCSVTCTSPEEHRVTLEQGPGQLSVHRQEHLFVFLWLSRVLLTTLLTRNRSPIGSRDSSPLWSSVGLRQVSLLVCRCFQQLFIDKSGFYRGHFSLFLWSYFGHFAHFVHGCL